MNFREKFNGVERIAKFDDVLDEVLRNGQHIFIDIKEKSLEIIQVILDAYKKHPELYERAVVSSFHPLLIYMVTFIRDNSSIPCWKDLIGFDRKNIQYF